MLDTNALPIEIGTVVKPWGTVMAVGIHGGERYYWLSNKYGVISMMPADVVETQKGIDSSGL